MQSNLKADVRATEAYGLHKTVWISKAFQLLLMLYHNIDDLLVLRFKNFLASIYICDGFFRLLLVFIALSRSGKNLLLLPSQN